MDKIKIILAGIPGGGWQLREREIQELCESRLWSYYYILTEKKKMEKINKVELFLDSGAFSAKTQGVEINLQEYIAFIKEHEEVIEVYANLDVIGDAKATYKNQKRMEKTGLIPMPVFHYGADVKWLEKYIAEGHKYIALGGMVKTPNLIPWLDNIWHNYLTDEAGFPIIKVHGFGLTSLSLMLRFPWYSVDSTSWVVTGRLGSIYMPHFRNGKWTYDENSWKISVSNKSPDLKIKGAHYQTLSPLQKKQIDNYLALKGYVIGKSEFRMESQTYVLAEDEKWGEKKPIVKTASRQVEKIIEPGISNKYQLRDEMNIIYFLDLEKSMPKYPWPLKKERKMEGFF